MKVLISLVAVLVLLLLAWIGVGLAGLHLVFGVVLPYLALSVFVVAFGLRIAKWAGVPVPFRIPTTAGQQKTLPWIKSSRLDNPHDTWGVLGRMALEILFFRSLFRNTKTEVGAGPKVTYGTSELLWLFSLVFHWCMLVVVVRHLRFFFEPIPFFVEWLEELDGFLQIGSPVLFLSGLGMLAGLGYLFLRRVVSPQLRYVSLPADYFALFLLLAIGTTGVLVRHFVRADIVGVKELTMGLATLSPVAPDSVHWLVYGHLFLVCSLLVYFPFSKLVHMGGAFLSPTRNLANNNRAVRHENPWDYPVEVHTYEEYEDEFREKMVQVGIPVDKE